MHDCVALMSKEETYVGMRQSGENSKIAAKKIENRGVTPNMSGMTLFIVVKT